MKRSYVLWALGPVLCAGLSVWADDWNRDIYAKSSSSISRPAVSTQGTTQADSAISRALKVYEKIPDSCLVNTRLAYLYFASGKYANAEFHYKKALDANEYSVEARLGLYLTCTANRDYGKAADYCRDVIRYDPLNFYANLYLANSLTAQNKHQDAAKVLRTMLQYYPTNMTIMVALQRSYEQQCLTDMAQKIQGEIDLLMNN